MNQRFVSITIPTYNSEETLEACLESIAAQDYPAIETIIVDSHSTDATREISERWGATFLTTEGRLLAARAEGVRAAQGAYVGLLDSDQVLAPTAITRAVEMMQANDVLYLEERSLETRTLIQRLFDADRQLVQSYVTLHADSMRGVLLGRFVRREILAEAIKNIPGEVTHTTVAFDHDILNYEVLRLTDRVALLPDAIYHHEPETLGKLWRKNFRYGKSFRALDRLGYYAHLRRAKAQPRRGAWQRRTMWWGLQSNLLLALKVPAILAGYVLG